MGMHEKFRLTGRKPPKSLLTSAMDEVLIWREQLVRSGLRAMVIIGLVAVVAGAYYAYTTGSTWVIPFYLVAYAGLLLVTLVTQIPYNIQAATLVGLIYLLGVVDLLESGRGGDGRVFLLAVPLLAVLFFGRIEGLIALGLNILTMAVFAWLYTTERIIIPVSRQANFADPFAWLSNTLVLLMLGTFLVSSLGFLVPRLISSLTRSRRLLQRLDDAHKELRVHSEKLTLSHRLLGERAKALEVTAALARDAASIHDLQEILDRVVNLISERFNFYHAGIFLVDQTGEWAVLRAASSEGGQAMLEREYKLPVGKVGIVGFVTAKGKPRVSLAVDKDAAHLKNPDLPDTRSEMTVPLRARRKVIGALDVQSTDPQAFSDDDVNMLQAIADQLAMVISNVRLYNQVQESLEAEQRAYRDLSQEAWNQVLGSRPDISYRYHHGLVSRQRVDHDGKPHKNRPIGDHFRLEIPMRIRGQVVGTFVAKKASDLDEWTQEERHLLHALVDQLSIALESARLYSETQQRAMRERLVTDITTKMRATADPDLILQTAVSELTQALHNRQVRVHFKSNDTEEPNPPNGSNS
jgi:GAF domain-containing protein